jgi:ORF6N domain
MPRTGVGHAMEIDRHQPMPFLHIELCERSVLARDWRQSRRDFPARQLSLTLACLRARKPVMSRTQHLIPLETIERRIYVIRDHKVMMDRDLAELYCVETRVLVQAVKRNIERFPEDFMFQLDLEELKIWRSQIVISNPAAKMGLRRNPYVFTEHGILMLSSVLHSEQAVQVNIAIMRAFVRMREAMISHKEMARRIDDMERKYDTQFKAVFDALRKLMEPSASPKKRSIGYIIQENDDC